jgi:hypothetical protein
VEKKVTIKLPITIKVDREKKTYWVKYGEVPPIMF